MNSVFDAKTLVILDRNEGKETAKKGQKRNTKKVHIEKRIQSREEREKKPVCDETPKNVV